jgi:hypothetical protein
MNEQMKNQRMLFRALKHGLLTPAPQIVRGAEDYASLKQRYESGERKEVRRILQERAGSAVIYWLRKFGSKRGAPQKQDPLLFHNLKIYKERKRLSWSQLAEVINPTLLGEKPTAYNVASAVRRAEVKLKARKDRCTP